MDATRRAAFAEKYGARVDRNLLGPEYFQYLAGKSFHVGAMVPAKHHNSFSRIGMHAFDRRFSNERSVQRA